MLALEFHWTFSILFLYPLLTFSCLTFNFITIFPFQMTKLLAIVDVQKFSHINWYTQNRKTIADGKMKKKNTIIKLKCCTFCIDWMPICWLYAKNFRWKLFDLHTERSKENIEIAMEIIVKRFFSLSLSIACVCVSPAINAFKIINLFLSLALDEIRHDWIRFGLGFCAMCLFNVQKPDSYAD